MLSVIVWECTCGCKVKVMYDTNGAVILRCPIPPCTQTHIVHGAISDLWIEVNAIWKPHPDVSSLIAK
jgi:hypothetical protein